MLKCYSCLSRQHAGVVKRSCNDVIDMERNTDMLFMQVRTYQICLQTYNKMLNQLQIMYNGTFKNVLP